MGKVHLRHRKSPKQLLRRMAPYLKSSSAANTYYRASQHRACGTVPHLPTYLPTHQQQADCCCFGSRCCCCAKHWLLHGHPY